MNNSGIDRISPVFVAWNDSGKNPHRNSSETYGERVVQHYEIEYIVTSRSGYILTDGIPIQAVPQSVFFRIPGMVVEGIGVYHSLYVEYDINDKGEVVDVLQDLPPVFYNMADVFEGSACFQSFNLHEPESAAEKLLWKAKIQELLAFLIQRAEKEETDLYLDGREKKRLQPVKCAIAYVQLHFSEPITLQALADAAGYSTYYFCKLFKQVTKLTPMQYVVRYRIEQAEKRLITSNDPAETVMLEVGFHNYGYFWRTFKEIFGLSPQEYRKTHADI